MDSAATRRGRLVGVDGARGFAIGTMLIAHLAPLHADSPLAVRALIAADAITAPLFALLVGVSLGLMSGGTTPIRAGERRGRLALQAVIRALLIIVLGFGLDVLGSQIAVVLQYLGVAMLLVIPLMYLRPAILLSLGLVVLVLCPFLVSFARGVVLAPGIGTPVLREILTLLFTGRHYQACAFAALALVGLAVVRFGLGSARVTLTLLFIGTAALLLAYGSARPLGVTAEAYAATLPSYAAGAGWACAILGLFCWLTLSAPARISRVSTRIMGPLADVGAMTLTIYALQVVILAFWSRLHPGQSDDSWLHLAIGLIAAVGFATLWRALIGPGPLEWLIAVISGRRAGRARSRPGPGPGPGAAEASG